MKSDNVPWTKARPVIGPMGILVLVAILGQAGTAQSPGYALIVETPEAVYVAPGHQSWLYGSVLLSDDPVVVAPSYEATLVLDDVEAGHYFQPIGGGAFFFGLTSDDGPAMARVDAKSAAALAGSSDLFPIIEVDEAVYEFNLVPESVNESLEYAHWTFEGTLEVSVTGRPSGDGVGPSSFQRVITIYARDCSQEPIQCHDAREPEFIESHVSSDDEGNIEMALHHEVAFDEPIPPNTCRSVRLIVWLSTEGPHGAGSDSWSRTTTSCYERAR